jgi:hypothetical protein
MKSAENAQIHAYKRILARGSQFYRTMPDPHLLSLLKPAANFSETVKTVNTDLALSRHIQRSKVERKRG